LEQKLFNLKDLPVIPCIYITVNIKDDNLSQIHNYK